jgi:hypothetical protein
MKTEWIFAIFKLMHYFKLKGYQIKLFLVTTISKFELILYQTYCN